MEINCPIGSNKFVLPLGFTRHPMHTYVKKKKQKGPTDGRIADCKQYFKPGESPRKNKVLLVSSKLLRWSRGERAGLWYLSSRVQTRPKPSDFLGEMPSFGGEVKPSVPCRKFTACKRTQK